MNLQDLPDLHNNLLAGNSGINSNLYSQRIYLVYANDFLYKLGHNGLIGHLKSVGQLDATVYVLNVSPLDAGASGHVKSRALVRTTPASVPIFSDCIHAHACLQTLGEAARWTPFSVVRGYVAFAFERVTGE